MSRWGHISWRKLLRGGAVGLLIVAAFFGVLAYGGTLTWGYAGLELLVAASAVLWVVAWSPGDRPSLGLLCLPMAPLAAGYVQLVTLPRTAVEYLSPEAYLAQEDCRRLLAVAPRSCLSVYPEATWRAAIQIALFACAGLAAMKLASTRSTARAFALALAGLGLLEWAIGIAFPPVRERTIYGGWHQLLEPYLEWRPNGRWPAPHTAGMCEMYPMNVGGVKFLEKKIEVGDVFGSFVVSNHFAGCLELCLPFALGLCLVAVARARSWPVKGLSLLAVAALAGGSLWTVAFAAQSRAGGAALLLAVLATFWAGARGVWSRRVGLVLALALLLAVLWVLILAASGWDDMAGQSGAANRLPGWLGYAVVSLRSRLAWWESCFAMFSKAPVFGVGMGGFGSLAPNYSSRANEYWYYAHNDYAQFLAETGLAGIAWIVATGVILRKEVLRCRSRGAAKDVSWPERAIAIGSSGALAGFALHSLLDWNLHVPANALLAALVFGLWLAGVSGPWSSEAAQAAARNANGRPRPPGPWAPITLRALQAAAVTLLALGVWSAGRDLWSERPIDALRAHLERFWVPGDDRAATLAGLPALLPAAEQAAIRPGSWNADYARLIGAAYLRLSGGRRSSQLILAFEWFARALERRPVDKTECAPLEQISAILNKAEPPPPDRARR